MRPDKQGNHDGAQGKARRRMSAVGPRNTPEQREYDAHYDRAVDLLSQGVTPVQVMRFEPDLARPVQDYLAR